ncbi:MAG: hypothetical protein M1495_07030 [Bacteroidetes bacterium]|nr:hypothetical protein [Bacteroidota bacterium]
MKTERFVKVFITLFVLCFGQMELSAQEIPTPLSKEKESQLIEYLKNNWASPEEYITGKFKNYDVVLLAEDHRIKHNLLLVQSLIPHLYKTGVYNIGMEFGASEDQAALDSLVTAKNYDEDKARKLMFNYNVGWAFKEYIDVYRKAWEFNNTLPDGARKFRIVNLSYKYDWSGYNGVRTPENVRKVFHKGGTESYRAALVKKEILDKHEKILIITGTIHGFTRYAIPMFDYNAENFCMLDDRYMGNLIYKYSNKKACTILLHFPFYSQTLGYGRLMYPANGAIDQVMKNFVNKRVGFDLSGTPFGELRDTSFYSTGYNDFKMSDIADGYIYQMPFNEYEGCTIDDKFLTKENWSEAQKQFPDPDINPRPKSLEEYYQKIRDYADIQKLYGTIK